MRKYPFLQRYLAEKITIQRMAGSLTRLSSVLAKASIELNPHQIYAALYAFNSPLQRGAILADEVGLGKTIEAGIIISQLWAEGKRKVLIITPASLRKQWQDELSNKFGLDSEIYDSPSFTEKINNGKKVPLTYDGIFIVSYQFAYARAGLIEKQPWTAVFIDEAHRMRRVYRGRDASKMAYEIRRIIANKPKVLLTATPLQNNLMELYGIASFIDDKLLGTSYSFKTRFVDPLSELNETNKSRLRELRLLIKGEESNETTKISGILTRSLRKDVLEYVRFTDRKSMTFDFTPTEEEVDLYEKVSSYLQRDVVAAINTSQRNLMILVYRKLLASSSFAIAGTLKKLIESLQKELNRFMDNCKLNALKVAERSESSYIIHDIIPLFARYGYPSAGDHENIKINDVPIYRPSGGKAGAMDIVYYYNGVPILLVEAKREARSPEKALEEAENYLRNFPVKDKKYTASGYPPKYFAITIGREIKFYQHRFDITSDGLLKQISEPVNILTFDELLEQYGLVKGYKPKILDPESFRKDFLNELVAVYNTSADRRISPEVIKHIAWHILNYLENQKTYVNRYPYIELDNEVFRQEHIKDIHRRLDLLGSLGTELAEQFRSFILRAFQGTALNQYLTELCVIAFMLDLSSPINPDWKILDFECGSGGFLAAAAKKNTPIENMLGIDIDELPYIVAKTYLALYFKKAGKKEIEQIPVKCANGLLHWGDDWDFIVGNPAGNAAYERDDIDDVLEHLESDLNLDGRPVTRPSFFSVRERWIPVPVTEIWITSAA